MGTIRGSGHKGSSRDSGWKVVGGGRWAVYGGCRSKQKLMAAREALLIMDHNGITGHFVGVALPNALCVCDDRRHC